MIDINIIREKIEPTTILLLVFNFLDFKIIPKTNEAIGKTIKIIEAQLFKALNSAKKVISLT